MAEQEVEWVELGIRKMIAVIRCRTCGYINRNEDYGDQRIGSRVLLHCPGCNQTRYHTLVSKVAEVELGPIAEAVAKKIAMRTKLIKPDIESKIPKTT